ncbi:sensor histidine kinase [Phenylobacterium sp.]|jgi:two-component system CheB/CheR fusion protein|uniref:sensor histidine kinase n=1 Tax=Phenylobacterium sp. TaxID=1871053 RepID=UPI002E333D88|nr:PAS domain-containing protein [Phenylobacterium sp.]HEX2560822.1 PAS domain-containing protein [Phenylobacterium sp.]
MEAARRQSIQGRRSAPAKPAAPPAEDCHELIDASEDGLYAVDREWRLVRFNTAAEAYFQVSRSEVLGRHLFSCFPQVRGTGLEAALTRVMEGGEPEQLETPSTVWPERRVAYKVFPTATGIAVWFRNVTEARLQEEARLAELEAIYRTAPVGLALLDRNLRYVRCNDRLAEIDGVPAADHPGRRLDEVVNRAVAEAAEPIFASVIASGRPIRDLEFSAWSRLRNEVRTWVANVSPMPDRQGGVGALLVSVDEITARKQAEAALAESETKFRISQEAALDGFMILKAVRDPGGRVADFSVEFANRVAREWRGTPNTDPDGTRLLDALGDHRDHPDIFPRFARILSEQGRHETITRFETNGAVHWFRNAAVAIDGERLAVSFRDVTRRVEAEHQLRLVVRELEHRGSNVLALIQGLMRVTLREAGDMDAFETAFTDRLRVLAAAQSLVTDAAGGPVPLREVVMSALSPFRQPGLRIRPGRHVTLPASAAVSLTLALHELATNALKYGALSVPEGVVEVRWTISRGWVELLWQEHGGPPVTPPQKPGLGSPLVAGALAGLPGSEVRHEFPPEGVRCLMRFRVD